ncbi:MAG: hypothetical protein ACJ72H_24350, partial [Candidatus Sulfotelmatobacter sp.]
MRVSRLLWVFLLMFTVWAAMTAWEAREFMGPPCPEQSAAAHWGCMLASPIAELQLATSPAEFKARIDQGSAGQFESWNLEIARVHSCTEFLSIGLYWAVFVLFALECGGGRLRHALIGVISLAAIVDVLENVRLLEALGAISRSAAFSSTPRGFSIAKWILLATALVIAAILAARAEGRWRRVMSALLILSAAVASCGVFWIPLFTVAAVTLFAALLIATVLYAPLQPWTWEMALMWLEFSYLIR